MSFLEPIKLEAKKRSHYTCVWCQRTDQFIEVHHITPQEEGGPDTLDNAAPLCPNCHTNLGNNTETRRQLRERRDWLWDHCVKIAKPGLQEAQRLDQLVDSLRAIEVQGGRNEGLLTELKGQLVGRLYAQATAISSASTATQLIQASSEVPKPQVYQLTATVTFSGTGRDSGMPHPYHSYFVVASTGGVTGPGGTAFGAAVTIIPVSGDTAGETQHLFVPHGTPQDGVDDARRTLRGLPQNQGLREDFFPRAPRAA